ncbi:XAC2610-related protein [Acinetobacter rudis]|uniref:Uncharacterized protein n=1 Tax=Acinetobacter rudis TaxID=632955 RepID=A0AAW8JCI7_9GAMM|nr:hypothetical protein [Acinetobacter rudis]MDQ8936411.1 hypothetical protein [Acinetobacter rudis]MDQ8952885.1 hypothetical protein [Acinetobacter rudis]MDQ9018638.1 hypothetical protein [Acinetobacter rudis]
MKLSRILTNSLLGAVLVASTVAQAEIVQKTTATTAQAQFKSLSNVKVNMQRMLRSTDGQYYLDLYAGVWNPRATLTEIKTEKSIRFEGLQKANQLNMASLISPSDASLEAGDYQLNGQLNAITGQFTARLVKKGQLQSQEIQFEPAFKVTDKPAFLFKFYTPSNAATLNNFIERIDVVDQKTQKVVQQLTGFKAYNQTVDYKDINFDGHYDLVLSDASNGRWAEDQHHIYWMYNPKTAKFQRSTQLEKIQGYPNLDGIKQQINFANGSIYQVEKGLLNKIQ